jgi:hypothetical protein
MCTMLTERGDEERKNVRRTSALEGEKISCANNKRSGAIVLHRANEK